MLNEENHKIEQLRDKLHKLIEADANYDQIYQASVDLDVLIEEILGDVTSYQIS